LGEIYADPDVHDDGRALAAFQAGLKAVPIEQKDNYRNAIPEKYQAMP
jgi:hypothetical protein